MERTTSPEQNEPGRDIATITIYPPRGQQHATAKDLSALAAYTRSLLHALPEKERKRQIVFTNRKLGQPAVFEDFGIEVREVWQKGSLLFIWQIIRAIAAQPTIKLVHLQHEFNQFGGPMTVPLIPVMLWILRFLMKKKVVVTFHEVIGNEMLSPELIKKFCIPLPSRSARFIFKWYYRITSRACNMILVQHQKIEARLRNEIGVGGTIRILQIGTEEHVQLADRATSRADFGLADNARVILFFGTMDWRKGLDVLLEAFKQLDDRYYLIIGGGQPPRINHRPEYKNWLADLVQQLNTHPRIHQAGFVDDDKLPSLFAASDLVVLPYLVPQIVSAVLNHAASHERPFIGSDAFEGHVEPLVLFKPAANELKSKIEWAFGHKDELLLYAKNYKHEKSWIKSAALLSGYYQATLANAVKK